MIFGEATYIDIILPLPIKQKFTYQLGDEHLSTAEIGCRVAVPFGRSKIYAGLIDAIHTNKPDYEVKFIIDVLDELMYPTSYIKKADVFVMYASPHTRGTRTSTTPDHVPTPGVHLTYVL